MAAQRDGVGGGGVLSVLTGMVGHSLLYYAQRAVPIATISVIQTSQPSQSTFWAWVLLGEAVTAAQVPGMVLATAGVALVVWFSRRPAVSRTEPGPQSCISSATTGS